MALMTGCGTTPGKKLEKMTSNAPDAAAYLLSELTTKKIIFINDDHTNMNEEIFLTDHLQAFYDAGVRYFFGEIDLSAENFYTVPSYPWMTAGARIEARELQQALQSLKQSTAGTDPFIVVSAEAGGKVGYETYPNDVAWLNYRDDYMMNTIIESLNNAPPDANYLGKEAGLIIGLSGAFRENVQARCAASSGMVANAQ